jgi:hypothetical protein
MDDHVCFRGTKYKKGNNTYSGTPLKNEVVPRAPYVSSGPKIRVGDFGQFSNLYTAVDTPAETAWLFVWCFVCLVFVCKYVLGRSRVSQPLNLRLLPPLDFAPHPSVRSRTVAPCPAPQVGAALASDE